MATTTGFEVDVHRLKRDEFLHEELLVPVGNCRGLVVGNAIAASLCWAQANGDVDGNFGHVKLGGCLVSRVADDDDPLFVHDDRLAEAELFD